MDEHAFCRAMLRGARQAAKQALARPEDIRGMYADTATACAGGRYHWVYDDRRRKVWEGNACCVWMAKAKAINSMIEKEKEAEGAAL